MAALNTLPTSYVDGLLSCTVTRFVPNACTSFQPPPVGSATRKYVTLLMPVGVIFFLSSSSPGGLVLLFWAVSREIVFSQRSVSNEQF